MNKFKRSLFIFHRDLRLEDNTGLIHALKSSERVIPCFIFTPEQIEHNPYKGEKCLNFMLEALYDLELQLNTKGGKLYFFRGKTHEIVEKCIEKLGVDAVYSNRDYTPYSVQRDKKIESVCKKKKVPFAQFDDALLHAPEETLKANGEPYRIFTPFFNHAREIPVSKPNRNPLKNYFQETIPFENKIQLPSSPSKRKACAKILNENFSKYPEKTTHLSRYLKFTIYSPREIYWALCKKHTAHHPIIRQLFWRDFFCSIAFFFPHVFQGAFYPKYNKLKWSQDKKAFKCWCEGRTGFPFVDAAMREMNATGFMPNRQRMAAASFLIKDLHINWRWGERYFAQQLIDYDPAVNNGNWQWVASTGTDAQPYFRIFNPWNQQKKFDPDCLYIKKWIPELRSLPPKMIHTWFKKESHALCPTYPPPLVDHEKEAKAALKRYRSCQK